MLRSNHWPIIACACNGLPLAQFGRARQMCPSCCVAKQSLTKASSAMCCSSLRCLASYCHCDHLEHTHSDLQAVDSRLLMARMLAEQWFGFYMRPKTAADAWLVQGLAGYLEEKFVLKYMGRNELDYR